MAEPVNPDALENLWQQMLPDPAARAYANEHLRMLLLSTGTLQDGTDYYAYLSLSPANYLEMMRAEQGGAPFSLADFGEILQWGEGKTPPEEVQKRMAETYGANPNFATDAEDLLNKAIAQQQAPDAG